MVSDQGADRSAGAAGFPGGVGVSGLRVYDWPAADGVCGGSPHVHLVCAEAYVVVGGSGHVQTLNAQGYAETSLSAGAVVWFTPGTIHRLVNSDGRLHILVIMQNNGLPEAGDAVFTFPPATLADAGAYERAAALHGDPDEAALARRDLALEGFFELSARVRAGELGALKDFYGAARALKAGSFGAWRERWEAGPLAAAARTGEQLERLAAGDWSHLTEAAVHRLAPPEERRHGMCGRLDTYDPSAGRPPG
ncbi:cupin domain-containing protein [Actinomadura sp. HBU206391]|uniref:cupin domain-containing protein n=1 Tax=Actinomadura sp. HBU206391 TaxID=2731692 RepID=UPI00164FCBDC|nr:cupin domain-containing protein [Actinomadura sp. HBU206391]MBC6458204.1 cupin domain-containing protein [Actinomadura sp. HBU206391]